VSREKSESGGGLSITTLLISAVGAVAAATVVPLFWQKGTLIATAMTPVIVALVSEGLRKPAEKITAVAPRVTRRTATGAAVRRFDPAAARTRHPESVGARGRGPERYEPDVPQGGVSAHDPFGLRKAPRRPWWKIGLATGLLAFVIGAGVVTASELVGGGSVAGHERTSLFGGDDEATPSPTPTTTPEATTTPTPDATVTPTPTPSVTATPSPPPTATPDTQVAPTATATP
jgi:hypothetical protein